MPSYLLAHDIGTTGDKATLFDENGELLASAFAAYDTEQARPGWAEQDPEAWWRAVCAATREILSAHREAAGRIAAAGFSGMMNGAVLVDDRGMAVRPALIHADIRSEPQCARIAREIDPRRAYDLSGNRLAPYFTLAKLAWLAENEPESVGAARWCVQAKDYLAGRLTGQLGVTDPSDASLTGMFDMRRMAWSEELIAAGGFDRRLLPEVRESASILGCVTPEAAEATGLRAGTPVALGGGDGACATAGAGALADGEGYHYLGGTSWIGSVSAEYTPDPRMRISTLCGFGPARYVSYGTVQSAGSSTEWFVRAIGVGDETGNPYAAMEQLAETSEPGARGLVFLPYLQGERAPIWDANARGVLFGLSSAHTRADIARAVYEGVACALASILDVFDELGIAPAEVRALGGGMRCALWRRIFAGLYNRPLPVMERLSEATSSGAAICAGVAVGLLPDWEAGRRFARVACVETPEPALAERYRGLRAFYATLYPALSERFAALAKLQSSSPTE